MVFLKYFTFTDAPRAVYGQDSRQQDILSDGTGTITVYGLIGDQCLDDRDCFIDSTSCIEGNVYGRVYNKPAHTQDRPALSF